VTTGPRATVVVPTYNRPDALARCLDGLRAQTVPIEKIVVHEGDDAAAAVDAACAAAGATLIRKERGGVASARNAGIARASCDVVLLLDDDCAPEPDWAERLCEAFADGATVVAGGVVNATPDNPWATATQEIHYHLMHFPDFATANNIGARRDVFAAVAWDERYRGAGEDRDWCQRVTAAGHAITRVPGARVQHWQELDARSFLRKHVDYGRSSEDFRSRTGATVMRPSWYVGVVRGGFRRGARAGVLVGVAQVASAYGALQVRRERRRCR
jgi:GT2 family glycosyltransferase